MKSRLSFWVLFLILQGTLFAEKVDIIMVDTGQDKCYDLYKEIKYPGQMSPFSGQDGQFLSRAPSYRDNGNGTVSDLNTGLMWSKAVDSQKVSLNEAFEMARKMKLGGYKDWRVPNIKELYSLIDFRGKTGFAGRNMNSIPRDSIPYINTDYFNFRYGQVSEGERFIDGQWLSSTRYVSTTMNGADTLFGVNFVDGRIKGYGYRRSRGDRREKKFYVRFVRGKAYGENKFIDNGDGTITDQTTGLMWMKNDSGNGMNWKEALSYAKNLDYGGYDDWRLPNAKELQYIVDYSRSPDTTRSPAIDPIFKTTRIKNEAGVKDYPYFWTSTTHLDGPTQGGQAVYVTFGRALGKMHGKIIDVHGAGAQRSDPKVGSPMSRGPQGDLIRVDNFVRCVRGGGVSQQKKPTSFDRDKYPYHIQVEGSESKGHSHPSFPLSSPPKQRGTQGGFVARLDRDGDGKVSIDEFDGPSHHFGHLDRDGNGYLSDDEAPDPRIHGQRPSRRPPR